MNKTIRYCIVFVILIAAYFGFAVLSCLLPDESIKSNIRSSAVALEKEGLYPKAVISWDQCQMDNFTDALIMNQIYNIDRRHPVRSAMEVVRSTEKGGDWNQPELLLRRVKGEELKTKEYARYWHGNTFLFRPIFMMMDFNLLRWWLFAISSLLLVALACAYYRKAGLMKTLALALGFVATCGFVTQFSMQFFPVLAITLITCLIIVKRGEAKELGMLFFVVGSLTCYFDLLTTPLLTLGVPLAVMLSLKGDAGFRFKDRLWEIVCYVLLWGLGFALTFVTKWLIATLVLGVNTFADAYGASMYRLGTEDFTRWDALRRNFNMLSLPMILVAALIFVVCNLVGREKFNLMKAVLYVIVGVMPYVWFLVLSDHSHEHWWFTYRNQAITVICLFLILADHRLKEKC